MERFGKILTAGTILMLLFSGQLVRSQEVDNSVENEFEYRTYFKSTIKLAKNFKLNVVPEVRLKDDFSIDRYLLETELKYKPIKYLTIGGGYRFIINPRTTKSTEYLHRYEFSATLKKKFNDFKPALKVSYTNYADDDADDNFLRYKALVEYDIPKCKFTPVVGAELFHQLSSGDMYKVRYGVGVDYKLFKKNFLEVSYKLDYYLQKYKNKHIISIGYKLKF